MLSVKIPFGSSGFIYALLTLRLQGAEQAITVICLRRTVAQVAPLPFS